MEPPIVFHKKHQSKILSAILGMKLITSGSIISSSSVPRNERVNEYIFLVSIYMHLIALLLIWFYASYDYHVLMIIILFSILYATIIFLMIIIYTFVSWQTKQTGKKLVMSVYGKSHHLELSSSNFSTHVIKGLAGQERCRYQASMI